MNVFNDMAALLDEAREDSECPYPTYSRMIALYYEAKDENEALRRTVRNCEEEVERLRQTAKSRLDAIDNLRREKEMDQIYVDHLEYLLNVEESVSERLRELVAHLWRHSDFCKDCALVEECEMTADLPWECPMKQAHRDLQGLGIEMDG